MEQQEPLQEVPRHRFMVMGDAGVGKSGIKNHFYYERNCLDDNYDPAIEDALVKRVTVDDALCVIDIVEPDSNLDTLSVLDEQYMRMSEGFLCVYSITSRSSFDYISDLHARVVRMKEACGVINKEEGDDDGVPMVLVGNKCDLESQREVTTAEGAELAKALGCEFVEASVKEGINMEHSFFTLVRTIRRWQTEQEDKEKQRLRQGSRKKCILS